MRATAVSLATGVRLFAPSWAKRPVMRCRSTNRLFLHGHFHLQETCRLRECQVAQESSYAIVLAALVHVRIP